MGPLKKPPTILQRIPPLTWRQPVLVWTPAALALALGWPALILRGDGGLAQTALIGGALVFALGFMSMGAAWLLGRAPRTRREVVLHLLAAGTLVALAAPFALMSLLDAVAEAEQTSTGLRAATPYALTPLALVIGLPVAFFYGLVFSLVALVKRPSLTAPKRRATRDTRTREERMHDVQPFV
jgi:hypothetical protein